MQAFAGFIIFVSFIAFILGVVNVIRPQAWMKVRKRLIGAFIILGSMAGCVGGSIMSASADPGLAAAMEAGRAEREAREAKAAEEDKAKPAEVRPAGMTQAEFNSVWSDVKVKMERCDVAVRRAGEVVGSGNAYAAYGPTKSAAEVCRSAWSEMSSIRAPRSAKGEVKKAMQDARSRCSDAVLWKQMAMDALVKVLDGDQRPSAMSDATDKLSTARDLSTGCWLGYLSAAEKAGLDLPEFEKAMKDAQAEAAKKE